mmetsp:Transcript_3533/g.4915  ORF Transcript_3533/g.4915 Transcript_3533/m.4915 type:complete len:251 (+) Transcript_3533:29-781(+)
MSSSSPVYPPGAQPTLQIGTPTHVSEPAFEFLLAEMLHWVDVEGQLHQERWNAQKQQNSDSINDTTCNATTSNTNTNASDGNGEKSIDNEDEEARKEEEAIMVAERAAAKMEKMGYDVGYRFVERLAQSKTLTPTSRGNGEAPSIAMVQLEAVKFICKEFWIEIFRKQIDKLQTNHRGVFVLKDKEFKWLKRLPSDNEVARVAAIKLLAFPCGLIRGALENLGISAVVSCDFLSDGKTMSSCSFNIKVKG